MLRSDNEPAIKASKEAVKRGVDDYVLLEDTPVEGRETSNGETERAIRQVQEQARCIKPATEARLGKAISREHSSIPWMIRHAAQTLNRYRLGSDSKTAYQRVKGRQFKQEV